MFNVAPIAAPRRTVDFHSKSDGVERAPEDATLPADRVSLSPEARSQLAAEQHEVEALRQRDAHVRAHEAAHQAAGGDLTGAATFSYELGPDGRSYAIGGEVPVQARSGRTPDETIAIARRVRAAALAPSDPSSADLAAAAAATQVELRALQQKRLQQAQGGPGQAAPAGATGSTPQADLERLVVRSPEPEPFM